MNKAAQKKRSREVSRHSLRHPFQVDVVSRENDNIAGFSWGFTIWVALRKTGCYSVGASCYTNEPPTPRFPIKYPLRTGAEIWEAISGLYEAMDENEAPLDLDDAGDIADRLATFDPEMATALLSAAPEALSKEDDVRSFVVLLPLVAPTVGRPSLTRALVLTTGTQERSTPTTRTPEEQELLKVMRRVSGDEHVDRHEELILSQAYLIGEL